jgi:hypothetical protein
MPVLRLSWSKDDVKERTPIKPGVYEAVVDTERSEYGESDSGKPYVTVRFVIQNHQEYEGRGITQRFYLNREARWKFNSMLSVFGLLPASEGDFDFDTRALHGRRCRIRVRKSSYAGEERDEVAEVLPLEKAAKKAISF